MQHGLKIQKIFNKKAIKCPGNEAEKKDDVPSPSHTPTPAMHCPLCQEQFEEYAVLETHVMLIHSVNSDGLKRLLLLMEGSHWLNNSQSKQQRDYDDKDNKTENEENKSENEDVQEQHEGKGDKTNVETIHKSEACINLSDEDNIASQLGGTISSRHLYKYRCGQCSLAFKTSDKLALHSRYHAMREATRCRFCARSFRSVSSLLRHVESSHEVANDGKEVEYNAEEVERYKQSLINHPLLLTGPSGSQ